MHDTHQGCLQNDSTIRKHIYLTPSFSSHSPPNFPPRLLNLRPVNRKPRRLTLICLVGYFRDITLSRVSPPKSANLSSLMTKMSHPMKTLSRWGRERDGGEKKVVPSAKAALLCSEPSSCSLGSEIHPAQNDRNTQSVWNWQQMREGGFRS